MTSNNELVDFIKKQILIEKEIVKSLNEGLLNIKSGKDASKMVCK